MGGIIARFGVGHDGIDKEKAKNKNIYVTNTPGVLDTSVAEHTVWLMGCLARKVAEADQNMHRKEWKPSVGFELSGKTISIIGCGAIGRKVARICSFGFDMNVIGFDIAELNHGQLNKMYGISKVTRDYAEAVAQTDVVSVHLAGIRGNRHFFNKHRLKQIKKSALFINTSRGFIVDEEALYNCLKGGHLDGAGLDVFEKEPYTPISLRRDLRRLDNVILTPHIGSSTKEACIRMAERCMKNIKLWQKKQFKDMDLVCNLIF